MSARLEDLVEALPASSPEHWLELRRTGIGSSDAAAVVGLSPHRTALELWMDKTGRMAARPPSRSMLRGTRMEPFLIADTAERLGVRLEKPPMFRSKAHPWMLANLDAWVVGDPGRAVECKHVSARQADAWGPDGSGWTGVPDHYRLQVYHQMATVPTLRSVVVAADVDDELRLYTIDRDDDLIAYLVDREAEFWDRVLRDEAPPPDFAHRSTLDLVRELHPGCAGEDAADPRTASLMADFERVSELARSSERLADALKAELLHRMGTLARLTAGDLVATRRIMRRPAEEKPREALEFVTLKLNRRSS